MKLEKLSSGFFSDGRPKPVELAINLKAKLMEACQVINKTETKCVSNWIIQRMG
jgi:hypothetical protein